MFFLILSVKLPKENKLEMWFFRGCYDSVHVTCFWRANRFVLCKPLSSDSGQSIYLDLSHFICKTAALLTTAQRITSNNLYKILAKGFLFESLHPNNFPLAIGLYGNWSKVCLLLHSIEQLNQSAYNIFLNQQTITVYALFMSVFTPNFQKKV